MKLPTFTVLMVEDLATDRELYRRSLRQDSSCVYDLLETESVAAGLALCRTRSIDAVLLDFQLPDGNGLDFLERLAVQTGSSNPSVVMISGQGNEQTAVRAIKLGAEDYLVKSELTAELLLATLRSAIENTRLRLQLRQSEERFGTAIENMLDCFGIYSAIRDPDGQLVDFRFDYLNAAAIQSNRMTEADMSRTLCEVFPAHRETGLMAEYAQVVETGIPLIKEDLVYADVFGGERLTIAYNVQVAKLDDGIAISWRDITAQKQVELNLQAANQQITTIWESMTDAYVTLDRQWRLTYANSTGTQVINELLGSPTEGIIGKLYWDAFPWTVGTIVEREYQRAVTDRVAVHFELLYEPAETWFEIHAYPSDEGLGIYFRDINYRKRTELARIAADRERDRFFDLSLDLLIVANLDGYFTRVNPACERMFGFTSTEMLAQPFLDFVHPDDRAYTLAAIETLSMGDVLANFENRYRCKDGSYCWILWSALPDVDRRSIYANGRDITKRKREEELLQAQQATIGQQLSEIEVSTQRRGQQIARIASLTVILVGCAVLIGWKLELESLKSLIPGLASMKVNTALCFIWAGISLRLLAHRSRSSLKARIVNGWAIAITIVALLTICQYVLGSNLGIDELIFSDPRSPATSHPGRMGINTAVNFGLTGVAMWLLNRQDYPSDRLRQRQPPRSQQRVRVNQIALAQSLALVVGAIALQSVVGYVYHVRVFYQLTTLTTSMALHTAVGFVVLAVGMLALRSDRGWMRSLTTDLMGGDIARRFIPTAIVLPLVVGWLILTGLNANLYDQNFAFSLMSMSLAAISLGLIAKNTDIINRIDYDRIRSADRMRSSEERLKLALEGAKQGTWDFNLQTQELVWDDRCKEMFGLSPAAVVNYDRYLAGVYSEDRQRVADAVAMAIRDCGEFTQEHRTVHSDGTNWILTKGRCLCDPAGEPCRMSGTMMDISLRKQTEVALQASERMRRFMFEQTFEMIGLVDLDGVLLEVNQAALDSIAARSSEIVGRKFWETPWWDTPYLKQQLIDAIDRAARGEVMRYEVLFVDGNGNVMISDFSLKPLFDEDGQIVKLIAEGRDITERKRMERALRQRKSQLKLFVQHVPAGVAMFDRDMRYVIASDRWIDSYDLPDRDIVGRSHYDIFPDLPQRWKDIHQRCLAGAIESCQEDPFPRADGSIDWVRWEVRPWYTNADEVGGIIIFSEVITDRKIAAQRLQESEQRLKTGMEVAGVGLAKFDYATNLVELSPQAAALYGFASDTSTITRAQIHDTFHPDERAELEAVIAQVLDPQGKGWFAQDHRVVWQNGEVRCLSVRKQVFFDRSGAVARPSYAILAAIDITDRNRNQADLEQRNRELDSFVYVVSHDLKAPLRAVANLSQWIEDDLEGQLTADTQSQMNLLRSRVNRMSSTIDGLLDYARVGRSEDAVELVELAGLLADVIDSVAPPPTFTIDLPAELPTLSTKRTPLFQVFVNLVGNGIKHHHSEAGTIQISILQRRGYANAERGDFYEFAIADDGSGIAPEHHDRMFKIFQAVNPQNRSDSTGIGLAIVKKIVEAEGGMIWLESELGKGTTFYFTWPKSSGADL
jgi:PAS domain S-box-containing protein